MPPDTLLIILLTAIGAAALPALALLRAQRRIRHLEMTILARSTDTDQLEMVRDLLERLALQTEQLTDQQALLAARLAERQGIPLAKGPEAERPVTPH